MMNELVNGRAGQNRLQQFGIVFGHRRVVIYVEPDTRFLSVDNKYARTELLINSLQLPWAEYGKVS